MSTTKIPMVEIFETVEGEGTRAGFPTVFVRLYGCDLRCTWCDTTYSYPPEKAEFVMTIADICRQVRSYASKHICLTGGEPLLYGDRSAELIEALLQDPALLDLHIETNGARELAPFMNRITSDKVRYIMDYKLSGSGEQDKMIDENVQLLRDRDELKFVIASEDDFHEAVNIIDRLPTKAQILFSPVWETMLPEQLVDLMLTHRLSHVKLSLQLHKIIWDPNKRGV